MRVVFDEIILTPTLINSWYAKRIVEYNTCMSSKSFIKQYTKHIVNVILENPQPFKYVWMQHITKPPLHDKLLLLTITSVNTLLGMSKKE